MTGTKPLIVRHLSYGRNMVRNLRLAMLGVFVVLPLLMFSFTRAHIRAEAAVPSTLNFQARLLTSSGGIVGDGNYSVEFRLYTASTGGSHVWSETHSAVPVKSGYLSVYLGTVNATLDNLDWSQQHWLTMNVNADGEMNPRLRLTSVPYAFQAGQADRLTNGSGSLTADDLVQLAPGSPQAVNAALAALRVNQTGSGMLAQLQGNGSDVLTIAKTGTLWSAGDGTLAGGTLNLGSASQSGGLVIHDGGGYTGTISSNTLTGNRTYTLPNASGEICLTTTCSGGGGGLSFVQGGNAFDETAVLGTTDNFALEFKTNDIVSMRLGTDAMLDLISGGLQTAGTTRLTNAGALQNISTLNLSGAITGATSTNTINGLVINSGDLSSVTGITFTSGSLNINNGGITNTGSIAGATTITASGNIITSGGAIQTGGATRITSGGALQNLTGDNADGVSLNANTITSGTLGAARGGTGVDGSAAANGQLLIGNGTGYVLSTLTQGSGISITNGAGSIAIAAILGDSISESEIENGAVTTSKIADGNVTNAKLQNSSLSVSVGTGLSGGGVVSLGGTTTLNLADTAVTAGSYGSSSGVATFTVDAQGRLTAAGTTTLANSALQNSSFNVIYDSANLSGSSSVALGGTLTIDFSATPTFTSVTASSLASTGALSVSSAASQDLTITSGSGLVLLGASTLQASGSLTLDLANAADTVFTINNSGAGTAALNLSDGGLLTAGTLRLTNAGALQNITGLTVISGGASITGNSVITGTLGVSNTLTVTSGGLVVSAGGADITGGLQMNSGAISGVSTLNLSGAITGATSTNTINGLVINSGALSSVTGITFTSGSLNLGNGGITNTGSIAGATTITASGNINTTGGGLQTNSVTRLTNAGALQNITTINTSGNITSGGSFVANSNTGITVAACDANQYIGNGVRVDGGVVTAGSCRTDANTLSDVGLKENITQVGPVLDAIKALDIIEYDFKCNDETLAHLRLPCQRQVGVSAQQLQSIFPNLVTERQDGLLEMNVHQLSFYSFKAITELAELIDATGDVQLNNISTGGLLRLDSEGELHNITGLSIVSGGADIVGNSAITGTLGISSTLTVTSGGLVISAGGADITGGLSLTTGNLNVSAGAIQTAGMTRLSNAGVLQNITGLSIISGGASITGNSSITGTLTSSSTLTVGSGGLIVSAGGASISGGINMNSGGVTNAGSIAGVSTISASGAITAATTTNTINGLVINSGALSSITGITFTSGSLNLNNGGITNTGSIAGATTVNASGLATLSGGLTVTGAAINLNASSNFPVNIGTGTSTGTISIGGGNSPLVIDSTNFDVSSAGALSGITTISASGAITAATTTNTINGLIINSGSLSGITTLTASGNINTTGGGLQTNSVTRLTNAGALQNISTLSLSGAITGATSTNTINGLVISSGALSSITGITFTSGNLNLSNGGITNTGSIAGATTITASGNINTSGGAIQTGGTTRLTNAGALQNITTITASGNISAASLTAGNGATQSCSNTQGVNGMVITNGIVTSANGCSSFGLSDARLKENVVSLDSSILTRIKGVNTVTFDFNCSHPGFEQMNESCDTENQTGVIAQELATVFPELVYQDEHGYYRVKYDALNIYTLKSVSELAKTLDAESNVTANNISTGGALRLDNNGVLHNITGLHMVSGGASVVGGLNNNAGGISNTGEIKGATLVSAEHIRLTQNGDGKDFLKLEKDGQGVFTIFASGALELRLDSERAFAVNDSQGNTFFSVNTIGGLVSIGSPLPDNHAVLFTLDAAELPDDPPGTNGASYYNTRLQRFRCFQDDQWQDCLPVGFLNDPIALSRTVWTAMPAAETEFPGTPRILPNLKRAHEFRFRMRITTEGATGASCKLQYAMVDEGPWKDLGSDHDGKLMVEKTGTLIGEWAKIDKPARDEVILRVMCKGGDGLKSPVFYGVSVQLR